MQIEPYQLRSGVLGISSQRLVRRLCECAQLTAGDADKLGLPVETARQPVGCEACLGTGYAGRIVLAELLSVDAGRDVFSLDAAPQLERLAVERGMTTIWQRGCAAVEAGVTSPAEIRRVLGFPERRSASQKADSHP